MKDNAECEPSLSWETGRRDLSKEATYIVIVTVCLPSMLFSLRHVSQGVKKMFHFGAQAADGWKKTSEACGTTVSEATRETGVTHLAGRLDSNTFFLNSSNFSSPSRRRTPTSSC